jgi:hypothetical protein
MLEEYKLQLRQVKIPKNISRQRASFLVD